jgi:hypothetical protein
MEAPTPTKLLNFYNYRIEDGKFLADNFWNIDEQETYEITCLWMDGSDGNVYVDYIDPETGEEIRMLQREGYRSEDIKRVYGKTI